MSRPVKNLRFMGTAAPGPKSKNATPKGSQTAYGAVTKQDGRTNLGAGKFEGQSVPAFTRAGRVLTKYTGPSI